MLAWIDLETTGLNPGRDHVLEVACIVTDDELNEIARFQSVVYYGGSPDEHHEVVQKMHTENGLWSECASSTAPTIWEVDGQLAAFLQQHAAGAQLAGSTISFDRAFMQVDLKRAHSVLHYRNVDVTTLNELARRFWPEAYASRPNNDTKGHRAMTDVEESLRVCKHYIKALGGKL